jgi:hypothetical protein
MARISGIDTLWGLAIILLNWFCLYGFFSILRKLTEIKTVSRNVLDYLRFQIITGELKAGEKINENHIASQLDISRHPIHEAFRILENES